MRNRLAWLAILVLVLAALSPLAMAGGKGKSEGKPPTPPEAGNWKVVVTPDADAAAKGEKAFDDTLILHKAKFKSTACVPYGFDSAPYKVEAGAWMSDMESQKEGKSHWHGEVSGDSITGKMTWTKPDGTVFNYTFSGTRTGEQATQTQKS